MTTSALVIGAALLALGIAIGIALGAGWWRRSGMGSPSPTLEVAALLAPASDALVRVEQRLREVERERAGAYAGLYEQVAALHRTSADLGAQTRSLVNALRAPQVRGRWGEVQLQRIVELAGMVQHCDFETQVSAAVADAAGVRPDMIIRLAGRRHIPVDAKVPFDAWLQARECNDDARRRQLMVTHARAMRAHVDALAGKAYWQHFQPSPEFVVMFVPGEPLLDAAMTVDPGLTEYAFSRQVVICTPTTLIALLRTVAFTWRQESLSASAKTIHALGRELYGRLSTLGGHLGKLGANLERAVESYNAAVGSVESRVLVTARRFNDLGVTTDELPLLSPVQSATRRPSSPEWSDLAGQDAGQSSGRQLDDELRNDVASRDAAFEGAALRDAGLTAAALDDTALDDTALDGTALEDTALEGGFVGRRPSLRQMASGELRHSPDRIDAAG